MSNKIAVVSPARNERYLIVERLTPEEITQIFSKVEILSAGCWKWRGRLGKGGYGQWRYRGRKEFIHRVLFAWATGQSLERGHGNGIPELDHVVCDNAWCCNPTHVQLVSHKANTLRSTKSPTAINARKTHCLRGHELPVEPNRSDGGRYCRPCSLIYSKQRHLRRRQAVYLND